MFFFKLKYSLAFACVKPCIHPSTESNINKPHVSANQEELQQVAKCHTAINTRFTTAQLDWPASKFNRKQRAEYPERTWIFLDFNCQTIWNQFNKNFRFSLFVKPEIHLYKFPPPAISRCKCPCFDSNSKLHPPLALLKQTTKWLKHPVKTALRPQNGSCPWGVNYIYI